MPELVAGRSVLELGSGCGLCGIVAAKLGACQVTLSDYEPAALQNAAANMVSNTVPELAAQPSDSLVQDRYADRSQLGSSELHWQQQQQQHAGTENGSSSVQQPSDGQAPGAGASATEEEPDSADEALEGMWPADDMPADRDDAAEAAAESVWTSVRTKSWSV